MSQALPVYVVIPALDEAGPLPHVLADLASISATTELAEIIVVDNGSRDATARVARDAGATVLEEPERGYGAACLCGIEHVSKALAQQVAGDAIVVFLDADHSDYVEDLESLVAPIERGEVDFVVGSRLLFAEAREAVPLPSRVGNWFATRVIGFLHATWFSDLGPFRAIRYSALESLEMSDRTWGWTVEMQLRACASGMGIREVPVRYRARHSGRSKISGSLWGGMRAGAKILWILGRHLIGSWLRPPRATGSRP